MVKRSTWDAITRIRSDTDALENKKRITEEKRREDRYNEIQTEVLMSHKKNIGIDLVWQDLLEKEDCEELNAVLSHCVTCI